MRFFWSGFLVWFILALTFPLSIMLRLPRKTRPIRWVQNCLPFSVFMLSAFPTAMGIFCVVLFTGDQANVFVVGTYGPSWIYYGSLAALLLFVFLGCIIALDDFTSHPIGPYILGGKTAANKAFKLEKELRDAATSRVSSSEIQAKCNQYKRLVHLDSIRAIFKRGNIVALCYLTISITGTMATVFVFWYIAILVLSNQSLPVKTTNKFLTIFILLLTWLPMRVYMDWYQNYFHCDSWLRQSHVFWLGIVVASAALFFLVFLTQPDALFLVCTAVNTSFLVFIGLTGKFKPEWLKTLGESLQSTPFIYFAAAYTVFLFMTAIIGLRILRI